MKQERWDEFFMAMAYLVATQSKDSSMHIGAVIVDDHHYVRSVGYNGLPGGANESPSYRHIRPEKYHWYAHAERNAVCAAAAHGTAIRGCTMYTPGVPCTDCARDIIQSGISRVVTHSQWDDDISPEEKGANAWHEIANRSRTMFLECGVFWRQYDGIIRPITTLKRGVPLDGI